MTVRLKQPLFSRGAIVPTKKSETKGELLAFSIGLTYIEPRLYGLNIITNTALDSLTYVAG